MEQMTPAQVLRSLEDGSADPAKFGHREHLAAAFAALAEGPLGRAADRVCAGLLALATRAGKADRFHATQTWAFVVLLEERRRQTPGLDFDAFLAAHPELSERALLLRYYHAETLASDAARRAFVLPHRG